MKNQYHVYGHWTKTKPSELFYIGCGGKRRINSKDKRARNKLWHEIVDKHGFESEIIISFDNREEALAEAHKKPVINCRGEIFPSLTEAVNYYHMKGHTGISACLSTPPRSKSAGKYLDGTPVKWEYHIKELCP